MVFSCVLTLSHTTKASQEADCLLPAYWSLHIFPCLTLSRCASSLTLINILFRKNTDAWHLNVRYSGRVIDGASMLVTLIHAFTLSSLWQQAHSLFFLFTGVLLCILLTRIVLLFCLHCLHPQISFYVFDINIWKEAVTLKRSSTVFVWCSQSFGCYEGTYTCTHAKGSANSCVHWIRHWGVLPFWREVSARNS